jgi:putative FmdB family regulatory protein
MPIYEYQCANCGAISEFLINVGKNEPIVCHCCGGAEMNKILSAHSVISGNSHRELGHTCCGREERCQTPPCSSGGTCHRD